jgi:rod shape-determining protein MreD
VIQTTLFSFSPLYLLKVDCLLIVTIYLGFYRSPFRGIFLAFVLGNILDVFSGSPAGLFAFMRVLSCSLSKALSRKIFLDGILLQISVVFALSVVDSLAMIMLLRAFQLGIPDSSIILQGVFRQALVLALLSPLLLRLLRWLEKYPRKWSLKNI